jgi:hypothetical protein
MEDEPQNDGASRKASRQLARDDRRVALLLRVERLRRVVVSCGGFRLPLLDGREAGVRVTLVFHDGTRSKAPRHGFTIHSIRGKVGCTWFRKLSLHRRVSRAADGSQATAPWR